MDMKAMAKEMAAITAKVMGEKLRKLGKRLDQIEGQGAAINGNFADVNARLMALEDAATDPARRT